MPVLKCWHGWNKIEVYKPELDDLARELQYVQEWLKEQKTEDSIDVRITATADDWELTIGPVDYDSGTMFAYSAGSIILDMDLVDLKELAQNLLDEMDNTFEQMQL